jgi:hypothetical protein
VEGRKRLQIVEGEEMRSQRGQVTKEEIYAGIIEEVYMKIGSRQKMS